MKKFYWPTKVATQKPIPAPTKSGILSCQSCGLYAGCKTPQMPPHGEGRLRIAAVAEAPGSQEDLQGIQLIGDAGQVLRTELSQFGIDLDKDCVKSNSCRCFVNHSVSVYTIDGYKKIREIEVGDLVLTHKGRYRKVLSRTWDLPKPLRKNREDVYDIYVNRIDRHLSFQTGWKAFTVTTGHQFMMNGKWISVENLNVGDHIRALGSRCVSCGKVYFKSPGQYDETPAYCCASCQMDYEYGRGIRDNFAITAKANEIVRTRVKLGTFIVPKPSKEQKKQLYISVASSRQTVNGVMDLMIIGHGERELANYFIENGIEFISQYAIQQYNYDFYLPDYDLIIEVDNPDRIGQQVKESRDKIKDDIALSLNIPLVRISSISPVKSVERLLKNHDGDYVFTEVEIIRIEKRPPNQIHSLYCIEVEEDNSFIAKGIIHHNCRPPSNRKPTNLEIECCKRDTWQQIKEFQPKAIWLMGASAIKSFFWDFESGEPSINKWRGWCIPNHEYQAFIFPMYHPSYVLRNPKDQGLKFVFHQDIENAVKNLKRPFPKFVKPIVHKLTNKNDIETVLRQANEDNRIFTFDYETTGLKPYKSGHKIVYAAFSRDGKEAFAFPFPGNEELWKTILRNSEIPKSAHNMKFEELWSREILDTEVQNWVHCSMLCAHVLDDRSEITSLRWQIMQRYGEMNFKDESDPYLKAPHGNDFNNILKAPVDLMLQRVGDDAGWEARLYYDQVKELKAVGNTGFQTLQYGFDFFKEGSLALVDAEQAGMKIDEEYLLGKKGDPKDKGVKGQLEKEIAGLKVSILDNRYVKQFFGGKFNPKSDVQLKKLLYSDMKLVPTAFTAPTKAHPEGTPKVDKAALEWIAADKEHPMSDFVSDILQFKKQSTLHSTFIVGLMNEVWDGSVHSFYNLHLARTFRSSSSMPNAQNYPMRDKDNSNMVRSAFYPYPGYQLLEADFCLSGDTEIESITGKRNIKDIIENHKHEDIYVYCYNLKEKRIGISKVLDGKQTGTKKEVWKVILDNGEFIIATPEHKFMLRNGEYKEVKDLIVGQSLMPLYKRKSHRKKGVNYEHIYLNDGKKQMKIHNLIALDVFGTDISKEKLVVHHINGNGLDNRLENLAIMDRSEHMRIHVNQSWEDKERKTDRFEWHKSEEGRESTRQLNEKRKETWTEEDWRWWKERLMEGIENRDISGENNGMWKYNWSDEQKKQMSETKTGVKTGKPAWNTGLTKETDGSVRKISDSMIGKEPWNKGLKDSQIPWNKGKKTGPLSEEHKEKIKKTKELNSKKRNNHKVTSIEFYGYEDVYNITVKDHHNFALGAGVIVKNSGIEVRLAAVHTQDPVLIKYIKDPTSDMHRDQAQNLFLLDREQVTKILRYNAKNQFVFPEFYGSWFGACAANLWNTSKDEKLSDGTPVLKHLAQQRIRVYNDRIKRFELKYIMNLETYTSHVQAEEENFWERFKVYAQWKEEQLEHYYETGTVPMYFGFRRQGHLGKNKILNTSIQGTAFHCLLWCFIRLNSLRRKFKWKSLLCGQIHDSIIMSVHPDEKDMILKLLRKIMTQDIVKELPFINIPLDIEIEMGEIDKPWSTKKEIKF